MRITLFTVEGANRLIPELRPRLQRLVSMKHELDRLEAQLAVLTMATTGAGNDNPDARELRRLGEGRARLMQQISEGATEIQATGALVKDLDRGLVDFYAVASGDRLILLCWQLAEAEVGHWHPLEGGFATRQPLPRAGRDAEPR